jgi:hypothetical protein
MKEQWKMAKRTGRCLENETGAALVIGLIMIVVLTLVAVASTYTSVFENKLSGNKRGAADAFYATDGCIQSVEARATNFDVNSYTSVPNSTDLPQTLRHERIVGRYQTPPFDFAGLGAFFATDPQRENFRIPGGEGEGTQNYESDHFIIDCNGIDQTGGSLSGCQSQVRVKVANRRMVSQEN